MDLTKGNVDMHFENSVGHDHFQEVSNGIKAGDQSLTGIPKMNRHLMGRLPPNFDRKLMTYLKTGSSNQEKRKNIGSN
jgi:hypothetical protein